MVCKGVTTTSTSSTFFPWLPLSIYSSKRIPGGHTSTTPHPLPSRIVSSPTSRIAHGNRRTPRQAPVPLRPNVAHSVANAASYTCGVPHLGSPHLRACHSHASSLDPDLGGLDRNPRTSPISTRRTTTLAAAAPESPSDATNSTGWLCASRCRGLCSGPLLRRVQGQSSWSFCLVHLCRFLGLPEFDSRTLTVSLAAYCPIHDNPEVRCLSQFLCTLFPRSHVPDTFSSPECFNSLARA